MRIGVAGPFNPACVREYIKEENVPEFNANASSVNIYVKSLIEMKNHVIIFTCDQDAKRSYVLNGSNIRIYCISRNFRFKGLGRFRVHYRICECIRNEIQNLDVLHAEWTYEYAMAARCFAKQIPTFCSVRDWCPYLLSAAKGWKDKYYWLMSYYMFCKVMECRDMRFIANSEYTKNQINNAYPEHEVKTIPNPIESKYILKDTKVYPDEKKFVSISYALHEPRKNIRKLLQAFQLYLNKKEMGRGAELLLIGKYDADWKNELESVGLLNGVRLLGAMSHKDIFGVLDGCSCLVHPSLEETFGNILLEAMCRRVPCIGGDKSGAVPQVLGYGACGILCDVEKPESIADAMIKIDDIALVDRIVEEGTKRLLESYADNIVARMHMGLFEAKDTIWKQKKKSDNSLSLKKN